MKKRLLSLVLALTMCVSFLSAMCTHTVYALGGGGTVTVTGTVSDANSNGISGASVKYETGGTSSVTVSTTTDDSGYYELSNVPKITEGTFTVSKDGYDSAESNENFDQDTEKNVTLTVKTYRATFDLDGGTRNDPEEDWACILGYGYTPSTSTYFKDFNYGTDYSTILAEWNNYIPTKTGCTFNGWNPNSGTLTEATTFTAVWAYTVTFDVQGRGIAPSTQTVAYGAKVTKPADPTETGYTFGGWYKEATCDNAWDFDNDTMPNNTMTLYAKWLQTINVTENPASNLKYNGSAQELGTVTSDPNDAVVEYKLENTQYYFTNVPTATNAGTYTVCYRVSKSGYATKTGSFNVTIAKRDVTLTSESASKVYNGTALTKTDVTYGALAGGESFVVEPEASGTITKVGQQTNTIDISSLQVKAGAVDTTANYEFSKDEGTLTVTPKSTPIVITTATNSKIYDGTVINAGTASSNFDAVKVPGETLTVTLKYTGTNAVKATGVYNNEIATITKKNEDNEDVECYNYIVTDVNGEDVTNCYTFAEDDFVIGTLTITAPSIDISKSSNVTSNGNKLTASFNQNNASSLVIDINSTVPAIANCAAGLYNDEDEKVCDCTCAAGSIKVTVPTSYLNTLSAGEHDLVLKIKDTTTGEFVYSYDLSITVNAVSSSSSSTSYTPVKTGVEGTSASPIKLVSLLSLVTIAGVVTLKKRKH